MTLNIMRYVLEVVTYIAVSLVFIVYTEKVYILPVLAKTVVTIITWINMKRVYKNSFGTFYTKETEAIIYWRNKEIWRVLLDLSCVLKNQWRCLTLDGYVTLNLLWWLVSGVSAPVSRCHQFHSSQCSHVSTPDLSWAGVDPWPQLTPHSVILWHSMSHNKPSSHHHM